MTVAKVILQSGVDLRVRHKTTFVPTSFHAYFLMNTAGIILKTASAFFFHQESFCWHDGGNAFKFIGQA
jgi:hypothetical protein